MSKKIAFFDAKPYDIGSFDEVNKNFNFDIRYFTSHLTIDSVGVTSQGYDAVCVFVNDIVTQEIVDVLHENNIKLIALRSAGYNNVDLSAAYGKIHIVRVPAYSPHAVAEHAVALMMALNRKTHRAFNRTRDNNFNIDGLLGFDMNGKTVGIVGTGKIGKVLIKILKGFGMDVLAFDLYPDKEYAKAVGFTYVDLDGLYSESDVISLNAPLTKDTFHMINAESLNKMKNGVMIINTGRGQLIDTKSLIGALKTGKVGYAGLDVYEEEADFFFKDVSNKVLSDDVLARLLTFNNVLITSHQGFFTREALHNIAETTLQNMKDFFDNKPIVNEVCYKCDK